MQLVVDKIARSFGINEIFKDISFMIDKGEKIGLVGVNGSGKTTLLRCLLAPETVDGGVVRFEPGLKIGYVEQGFQNIGTGSLWQFMLRSCPEIMTMREELAALEARSAQLEPGAELDGVLEEYARVTKRYEHVDGYNYEAFIKRVLIGLGFEEAVWDKTAEHFSGGQKTRMMLAAALVRQPDFLILDEPTNHLDIAMTEWLEKYLQESGKTINVDAKIKQLNDINWIEIGYKEGDTFSVYGKEYAIDSSGHINVSAEDEFTSTEIKYPSRSI